MKIIILALSLVSFSALAQNLHMIEMNTNSATLGSLSFTDDGDDTDKTFSLGGNYAYKISDRVQLGVQGNYQRFDGNTDTELYGANVGAIYNFDNDITNTFYVSAYAGMSWVHFSGLGNNKTEYLIGKASVGKRFALSKINLPNVTYSPEIGFTRSERTSSGNGTNTITIRFLQFSVFF